MNSALAVVVVIGAVWLVGSVLFHHNLRTCPRCKGTRKVRSSLFSSRYRVCPRCSGSGEIRAAFGRKD